MFVFEGQRQLIGVYVVVLDDVVLAQEEKAVIADYKVHNVLVIERYCVLTLVMEVVRGIHLDCCGPLAE